MKIAITSPPYPKTIKDGLYWVDKLVQEAASQKAKIICFPESYIPGYPGLDFVPEARSPENLQEALEQVCKIAETYHMAITIPMDWYGEEGLLNLAFVVSAEGKVLGYQTKNQLDPSEDDIWVPGTQRSVFEIEGMIFGITICHEGFRYPESVRWAAQNGAHIVFHPHLAGSDLDGVTPTEWGSMDNPYYEKAMMMRALENTIYFASCNYATRFPESASSLISPDGKCLAYNKYGEVGVFLYDIDLEKASGLLARRFKNQLYQRPLPGI